MSEERRWNPAACLARIALQDPGASRELVEHYQPLVWKLVRAHRSRSIPDEDLVREVFMKLFSRLDRYEPRDGIPFEHWLSRRGPHVSGRPSDRAPTTAAGGSSALRSGR
jgi:DNA-directed RNA polymerase specialized sigma subunit